MPDWKVESLRITGFTRSNWPEPAETLWAEVVGAPPDLINQRPRESLSNVEGTFEAARLVLVREPRRTDFFWSVERDASKPFSEYPAVGGFPNASILFLPLAKKWLSRKMEISRLAWGGVLVLPVTDREEGYKKLSRFLPQLKIDASGSSDLGYQINRPRLSKAIQGLRINRLCKWSVALARRLAIGLVISQDSAEAVGGPEGPGFSACRLEFDINSEAARKEPFSGNQLASLLDEFVALSTEIADRGDIT